MKNIILTTLIGFTILSCEPKQSQECVDLSNANSIVKSNLELYSMVWDKAINGRNIEIINLDYFDENIKAITAERRHRGD